MQEKKAVEDERNNLQRQVTSLENKNRKLDIEVEQLRWDYKTSLTNYKNSLVLLGASIEKRTNLEGMVKEEWEEILRLSNRAAAGFDDLTPRYRKFP